MKCFLCDYEGNMEVKSNKNNRNIIACPNCEVQFMESFPTDEEIEAIYSERYFSSWTGEGNTEYVRKMKKLSFYAILKNILPYKNSGNILDVGTAVGFLLEKAVELGFNPYGIEISEYASSIAKKKFGDERIYNGTLENTPFEENFFDIITMCDVIEHVRNPIETLNIASKLLKNDGYILITTPNTDSFSARIFGSKWHRYTIDHLLLFNEKSMKLLADKTNFDVIKVSPSVKVVNLNYLTSITKITDMFLIPNFINALNKIPIVNRINIPILMGEKTYILKKIKTHGEKNV